ncbi:MAG: N-6 DNA methylase [Elusimicrobia bacterium]|nr:N-6 DNA methylase [Elusimicrobiota bacterium]
MEFSNVIKELRKRKGLTQQKLSQTLGLSYPTINRWEKNKFEPNPRILLIVKDYIKKLGADYSDLRRYLDKKNVGNENNKNTNNAMDVKDMESMLWQAACSIRGEKDAPKFKDYILPLLFIKRLSDVFEDEISRLVEKYGDEKTAGEIIEADHAMVRFYIPEEAVWPVISGRRGFKYPANKTPKTLGEKITNAFRLIAKENVSLQGVIDIVDFNATHNGEREISDDALNRLIEKLSNPKYRLGINDVEPDFLGRAYEYLLRKFAEGQGQSAGEFFSPRELGWLIAKLMNPKQGEKIYDPCTGSSGLLIKCELELLRREGKNNVKKPLKLYGQELTGSSFAISRMNMVVHDMEGEIVRGNTMTNPKFTQDNKLKSFDMVVTNPMWNQGNIDTLFYENDPYDRFSPHGGYAPASSADWAWVQHIHSSLSSKGRAAIVLDTGAASRGSGSQGENKEKSIRKWFIDNDLVEAVMLMPDNLFYNTTAAGLILLINKNKPKERKGKIILINASENFEKGRPKNYLTDDAIEKIASAFHSGAEIEKFLKIVSSKEIAVKHDYNISPSRFIETGEAIEHRDIQAILNDLGKITNEQNKTEKELKGIFTKMGYKWK